MWESGATKIERAHLTHPRTSLDSHRCARPDSAGDAEPWRCPECGMVREALSPTPVTAPPAAAPEPPKRASGTLSVVTFVAIGAGALWFGLDAVSSSAEAGIGVFAVLLFVAVVVAWWQDARAKFARGENPRRGAAHRLRAAHRQETRLMPEREGPRAGHHAMGRPGLPALIQARRRSRARRRKEPIVTPPRLQLTSVTVATSQPREQARFYARLLGRLVTAEEGPDQGEPEEAGWALECGAAEAGFQPQPDVRVILDPDGHSFRLNR
ncbi:hypothetical protein GCM10009733_103580 [Nonomuraea maheshkhaliensis]|uniref:Glyoxalase-like domain-containing protein n=1 Tax=Nonomuraea maheshkhaliensis TaxID=419590 RepID=A0ABN2HNA8_9ACTN